MDWMDAIDDDDVLTAYAADLKRSMFPDAPVFKAPEEGSGSLFLSRVHRWFDRLLPRSFGSFCASIAGILEPYVLHADVLVSSERPDSLKPSEDDGSVNGAGVAFVRAGIVRLGEPSFSVEDIGRLEGFVPSLPSYFRVGLFFDEFGSPVSQLRAAWASEMPLHIRCAVVRFEYNLYHDLPQCLAAAKAHGGLYSLAKSILDAPFEALPELTPLLRLFLAYCTRPLECGPELAVAVPALGVKLNGKRRFECN